MSWNLFDGQQSSDKMKFAYLLTYLLTLSLALKHFHAILKEERGGLRYRLQKHNYSLSTRTFWWYLIAMLWTLDRLQHKLIRLQRLVVLDFDKNRTPLQPFEKHLLTYPAILSQSLEKSFSFCCLFGLFQQIFSGSIILFQGIP